MVFLLKKRGAVGAVDPESLNQHPRGVPLLRDHPPVGDSQHQDLPCPQQQSLPSTSTSPCRPPLSPAIVPLSKKSARVRSVPTVVTPCPARSGPSASNTAKSVGSRRQHRRRRSFDLDLRLLRGGGERHKKNALPKLPAASPVRDEPDELNSSFDVSEDGTLGSATVVGDGSTTLTVTSLLNDEPSLYTMRAGNLDDATSSVLTSLVCLSLIGSKPSLQSTSSGPTATIHSNSTADAAALDSSTDTSTVGTSTSSATNWAVLAQATPRVLVQAGLQRHVRFHLARILPQVSSSLDEDDDEYSGSTCSLASGASSSSSSALSNEEEDDDEDYRSGSSRSSETQTTESWSRPSQSIPPSHGLDPDEVHYEAYRSLQQGDAAQAIRVYRHLLAKQLPQPAHAQRPDTLSRLVVLHLLLGKGYPRALEYAKEALRLQRENDRPLQVAVKTMELGLVYFAANQLPQALKVWRGAMHRDSGTCGFEYDPPNPHLGILLNNMGVLHFKMGDHAGSIRALEESVELLRTSLRQANSQLHVECTIHHLALAMGNLAVVCDEGVQQTDRSVSLLQESLSLHESIRTFDKDRMDRVVQSYMERLLLRPSGCAGRSMPAQGASGSIVFGSISVFGNSDGIPSSARKGGAFVDPRDFWLLGSLAADPQPERVARAAILSWFGKQPDAGMPWCGQAAAVQFPPGELSTVSLPLKPRSKASIPVDLDGDAVVNAEQHLHEIHHQVMEHVEHGEADDALDVFASALKSHRNKYGENHHLVGRTLHNIGIVQLLAGQYAAAHSSLVQAIRVRTAALGVGHVELQDSQIKLALVELAQGDPEGACATLTQMRDGLTDTAREHLPLAVFANNLGVVQYLRGDLGDARSSFQASCDYLHRSGGPDADVARAHALSNLGFVCTKLEDSSSALMHLEEALTAYERHLPADDPRLRTAQDNVDFHGPQGWIDNASCEVASGRLCFSFA